MDTWKEMEEGSDETDLRFVNVKPLKTFDFDFGRTKVIGRGLRTKTDASLTCMLLFVYIDLPKAHALEAFRLYKETVIETYDQCGFSVEVSKCFPSDRFSIFLNEVYLIGRHVVHGVREAMGISADPTERHTSMVERAASVATWFRGAVREVPSSACGLVCGSEGLG